METKWEKRIKQLTTGNYNKAGFEVCLRGLAQLSSSVISFRALWTHFKVWQSWLTLHRALQPF